VAIGLTTFVVGLSATGLGQYRGSGKTKMTTDPKRKTIQDNSDRDKRRRQEEALDEALKNTFPASDPISVEQPGRDPRGSED
jgi:hypothetical protein